MSLTKNDVFILSVEYLGLIEQVVPNSRIYCSLYQSRGDKCRHALERAARTAACAKNIEESSASLVIYSGTHNSFKTNGTRAIAIVHEQDNFKYTVVCVLICAFVIGLLILRNCSPRNHRARMPDYYNKPF